jgi:dihydroorotate dehydrogenase electron transfer subunit
MLQVIAELIDRHTYGASQEVRLRSPEMARQLSPGQPVLVRTGSAVDSGRSPYLRRTFYPIAIDDETWTLRIPPSADWGHAWLRAAPPGTHVDCLGPVGKGYTLSKGTRNLLCLGEGEAAWTLLPAILQAEAQGIAVTFAVEALGGREVIPPARLPSGVEYRATERRHARSARGDMTVTTGNSEPVYVAPNLETSVWLLELLAWADAVLAAGSLEFYARLSVATGQARFGISRGFAQVLYPATFLCGTGACQACTADVAGGRRRVCLRGPVFDLKDVQS